MLKLMKLELKKLKPKLLIGVLISVACIFGFVFPMYYGGKEISSYKQLFEGIDTLSKVTFTIYGGVFLSSLVIKEYKEKTISVMFLYPIRRKKIIAAKLFIVIIFVISSIFLTNIFISGIICAYNSFNHIIYKTLTSTMLIQVITKFAISAVTSSGICLISLFFGMRKKSVSTTIVSSVIITLLLCSKGFDSIIIIPIILGLIGVLIAYLTIRNIENVDVEN